MYLTLMMTSIKPKPICCPPQSPNLAEWSLIFNDKKSFLSAHLLLYPYFTVSSLLTASSLSSKDSFKSSEFKLQIHNARAFPLLLSQLFLPPNVQILSIAAVSEKTKGRVFNLRWIFYGLHVSFSFVFNFSIPFIFQPCSATITQLKSSSPRASTTPTLSSLAIRLARWIWRKVHHHNIT